VHDVLFILEHAVGRIGRDARRVQMAALTMSGATGRPGAPSGEAG